MEEAKTDVQGIVSLTGAKPPLEVLDLCCGIGRHSVEFAKKGFAVTGVDRTQLYLNKALRQAETENLSITFIKEDIREYCRPGHFDLIVNLFTSFGYFEDPEDDLKVVKNACQSLKAGGVFVIELIGKEVLARTFRERRWREEYGYLLLDETRITKDWTWVENRWIILKEGKRIDLDLSHRLYSGFELSSLLKTGGFKTVRSYGDLAGKPYDQDAAMLVAVASK